MSTSNKIHSFKVVILHSAIHGGCTTVCMCARTRMHAHIHMNCFHIQTSDPLLIKKGLTQNVADCILIKVTVVLTEIPYFPAHKTHIFFPEKCDLNLTWVLMRWGYYFQTYKYTYICYTTSLFEIVKQPWRWFLWQWRFSGFLWWINYIMVASFGM